MRSIAPLCLASILSCLAVPMVLTLPAAAQGAPKAPSIGNPPPGGDALILWCRRAVFMKYGQTGISATGGGLRPGQKAYVMLDDNQIDPMINFCVQNKGQQY